MNDDSRADEPTAHAEVQSLPSRARAFLRRIELLSASDWRSIRLRRKDTKVYATAIKDLEQWGELYPDKRSLAQFARKRAKDAVQKYAPPVGVNSRWDLGNAAAEAIAALIVLYPWGESFERLYGPFSDIIPLRSLDPPPRQRKEGTPASSIRAPQQADSVVAGESRQRKVDYARALGFFGGEIFVAVIFLFVGAPSAAQWPNGLDHRRDARRRCLLCAKGFARPYCLVSDHPVSRTT